MKPSTRNRLLALGALAVAGAALAAISFGQMGENLVYYWSPKELLSKGKVAHKATIRLGGVVKAGSVDWDPKALSLRFNVADGEEADAPSVVVHSNGAPPDMFREHIGVVVEGRYGEDQIFHSDRVMVNHSNEYRPPKAGEKPRNYASTLLDTAGAQ